LVVAGRAGSAASVGPAGVLVAERLADPFLAPVVQAEFAVLALSAGSAAAVVTALLALAVGCAAAMVDAKSAFRAIAARLTAAGAVVPALPSGLAQGLAAAVCGA